MVCAFYFDICDFFSWGHWHFVSESYWKTQNQGLVLPAVFLYVQYQQISFLPII